MDSNSENYKKVSWLTLLILVIGIALIAYFYPKLNVEHDGNSRSSPIRGVLIGIFALCYSCWDLFVVLVNNLFPNSRVTISITKFYKSIDNFFSDNKTKT